MYRQLLLLTLKNSYICVLHFHSDIVVIKLLLCAKVKLLIAYCSRHSRDSQDFCLFANNFNSAVYCGFVNSDCFVFLKTSSSMPMHFILLYNEDTSDGRSLYSRILVYDCLFLSARCMSFLEQISVPKENSIDRCVLFRTALIVCMCTFIVDKIIMGIPIRCTICSFSMKDV